MENLRDRPKHAKHKQDTHEWGQMRNRLEDRHEAQTTYPKPEDYVALGLRKLTDFRFRQVLRLIELTLQLELKDESRHHHRYKRGHKYFADDTLSGDHPFDPKHDGRHVTDGRESTS